jgi:hypothetical protein
MNFFVLLDIDEFRPKDEFEVIFEVDLLDFDAHDDIDAQKKIEKIQKKK